jgi:hypothetical protein
MCIQRNRLYLLVNFQNALSFMKMRSFFSTLAWLAVAAAQTVHFEEHTIASDLAGGYQVVPFDINHDGKIDLIALASGMTELVWFENPGW